MKRFSDMLKQIPLISGFLAVIGLTSYLVMMILRSVVTAVGIDLVSSERRIVAGMLASTAVCVVICVAGLRKYMEKLGKNDVRFLKSAGELSADAAPSFMYAFLTCGAALAAYGAVLLLLNFYHWNFFEGPIFYLSFAFYSVPAHLYADTTVDYVYVWCEAVSFVICAVLYLPVMLRAYYSGFEKEKKNEMG